MKNNPQPHRHSWAFWFKQSGHDARSTPTRFINSRTGADTALRAMKYWHLASTEPTYWRNNEATYRTSASSSLPEFVALMKIGQRYPLDILIDALNDPMGITNISDAINCDATANGWRNDKHSDMKNLPMYTIHGWFKEIFKTKAQIINY